MSGLGWLILFAVAGMIGWHVWKTRNSPPPQQKEEDRDRDYGAPW